MKVSLKDNKWIFKFDTTTIICAINRVEGLYTILFELNNKLIKINTLDLDKTFLSLEHSFNSKIISKHR